MTAFGETLCRLRRESRDPKNGKELSQKRFGELLQEERGRYFSGAAVHYWESGESEIHKDDRDLLIAILKVLRKTGGVKSAGQAARLLRAGNFRALDKNEQQQVFPKDPLKPSAQTKPSEAPHASAGDHGDHRNHRENPLKTSPGTDRQGKCVDSVISVVRVFSPSF